MPPDTQLFHHAGDADLSGNYLFVTSQPYMHRLDESLQPLLEARGGRIVRLPTGGLSKRNLPQGFFARHAFRAAFTVDCTAPCDLIPSDLPLIAIPHAFWSRPQTKALLELKPFYLGTTDYYLTQDGPGAAEGLVCSMRRRDVVRLLPFGSPKIDLLRQCWLDEPRKDTIMYCCGITADSCPIPQKLAIVRRCLRDFPQYQVVVRPYPGAMADYAPLVEAFGHDKRFTLDTGSTTLRYLPRAAALLYDANTTTGQMFMLATGQKAICLPSPDPGRKLFPHTHIAATPREVSAVVATCLAQLELGEVPELRRLRETMLYRPGETRRLFWQYLADIVQGNVPQQAISIACEYLGDSRPTSTREELEIMLQRLQAGSVEQSCNLFRGYPLYTKLESFYLTLRARTEQGLPCLVRLRQHPDGQEVDVCPEDVVDMPFLCWSSLRYYGPAGLRHIQTHQGLRLESPPATDFAVLLPDRSKDLFCQAFAKLIREIYAGPSA